MWILLILLAIVLFGGGAVLAFVGKLVGLGILLLVVLVIAGILSAIFGRKRTG